MKTKENKSGLYIIFNEQKEIIYVGKSNTNKYKRGVSSFIERNASGSKYISFSKTNLSLIDIALYEIHLINKYNPICNVTDKYEGESTNVSFETIFFTKLIPISIVYKLIEGREISNEYNEKIIKLWIKKCYSNSELLEGCGCEIIDVSDENLFSKIKDIEISKPFKAIFIDALLCSKSIISIPLDLTNEKTKIFDYFNNIKYTKNLIGNFLQFTSIEKEEIFLQKILNNLNMYKDNNNIYFLEFNKYDWNCMCLYVGFVKWCITGISPDYLFDKKNNFSEENKKQFHDFKSNNHELFKLPYDYLR